MAEADLRDVQIFGMNNDTDQWAVIADNRYQLFDSQLEADDVFDKLVGGDINNSCFGAVTVVEPRHHLDDLDFTGAVRRNLSNHIEVDLMELKEAREAFARDVAAHNEGVVEDDSAFTFEELCEMGILTRSEENKKSYNMNMSKLQEWHDNQPTSE